MSNFRKINNLLLATQKSFLDTRRHSRTRSKHPRSFLEASLGFLWKVKISWSFQIVGLARRPWITKYSAQKNRFEASPIPLDRFWSKEDSGKLSAKSVVWTARFSWLKGATLPNNQLRWKIKFSLHPYYSSSRTGFPSHLRKVGKLLRNQTNSQILRYLHFSDPFTPLFDKPIWIKFPLPLYYS